MCILGTQRYHIELEQLLAEFLGVESCIAFGMVCHHALPLKEESLICLGFCN